LLLSAGRLRLLSVLHSASGLQLVGKHPRLSPSNRPSAHATPEVIPLFLKEKLAKGFVVQFLNVTFAGCPMALTYELARPTEEQLAQHGDVKPHCFHVPPTAPPTATLF